MYVLGCDMCAVVQMAAVTLVLIVGVGATVGVVLWVLKITD